MCMCVGGVRSGPCAALCGGGGLGVQETGWSLEGNLCRKEVIT